MTAPQITAEQRMLAITITHLGCAGHFIDAQSCRWRRHTQVGTSYRVSTIGNYFPRSFNNERASLGFEPEHFFETMVFRTVPNADPEAESCGCLPVPDFLELTCRRYATAGEAQRGHDEVVAEYALRAAQEEKQP